MEKRDLDKVTRNGLRISRSILFGSFNGDQDSISRLTVRGACEAIGLARSTFYYKPQRLPSSLAFEHTIVRRLEELSRSFPTYGYRRMTRVLREQGLQVNPKRILRLMNLYGFGVGLRLNDETQRAHFDISGVDLTPPPVVDARNRLWLAQLLRARVGMNLVHIAAVADAYSSEVIGFAVSPTLSARLGRLALYAAIRAHVPPRGCIHHSIGGEHYTLRGYSRLVRRYGMRLSAGCAASDMVGPGRSAAIGRLPTCSSYREALDHPGDFVKEIYQLTRSSMFASQTLAAPSPGRRTRASGGPARAHPPPPPSE
jgi:putative transposase